MFPYCTCCEQLHSLYNISEMLIQCLDLYLIIVFKMPCIIYNAVLTLHDIGKHLQINLSQWKHVWPFCLIVQRCWCHNFSFWQHWQLYWHKCFAFEALTINFELPICLYAIDFILRKWLVIVGYLPYFALCTNHFEQHLSSGENVKKSIKRLTFCSCMLCLPAELVNA